MEEPTSLSPASIMLHPDDMSPDPYLKLEDIDLPATQCSLTKPVKKRKSWGQELPEPKTTLPPRKRAKTDDEKEQRRIERIKRNRAAAHNSRERKRQEAASLEVANVALVKQMNALRQRIRRQEVQLAKCKELLPGGLPEVGDEDSSALSLEMEDNDEQRCALSTLNLLPRRITDNL